MSTDVAALPLATRRHACLLFETRDEEYRRLLPFILEGFAGGEKAYHVVNPSVRDDHFRRLERAGIDVAAARRRGQLEVRGFDEVYRPGAPFDEKRTIELFEGVLVEGRARGFPRTRVVGFGEGVLYGFRAEDVIEYESRINRMFARYDDPVVCAYDRGRLASAQLLDLLCAHPATITGGSVAENPVFVPPRRFVTERQRDAHVAVLRERCLAAIVEGWQREALEVVVDEGLWLDVPARRLCGVVEAVQREIGRLWRVGRVGMAEVHLATEVARRAFTQLQPHLPAGSPNGMHVVVACVEGEAHDLGARLLANLVEAAGFEVSFLGASVRADELIEFVRHRAPRAVALSAATAAAAPALRDAVAKLREAIGDRLVITAGGQAFRSVPDLGATLAVDVQAPTVEGAIRALRKLLSR